ncbi:Xaa-Pro peptidase family protein [Erysipelothrix urinaevulpis]|uniref:M24 family metallopeptidase n=1 Tax=Erysipelothrix urinaevulpis TaxID=2683717 RepID=UPI001359F659|nr:Xaa-Pro peptidase family protein [Erysipelothrix urinaevulpis]
MNERINTVLHKIETEQALIYDKYSIEYLIGVQYDVGERFIALLIDKNKEPILFLNKLFQAPDSIQSVTFEDHDAPLKLLKDYLRGNTLSVDGNMPSRFVLPLIEDGYLFYDIRPIIDEVRSIKSLDEQNILIQASKHNDAIMEKVKQHIKIGISEKELAEKIKQWHFEVDPEGVSFEPIVLFTENAADPHGVPSHRRLKNDDMILIDMGGYYQSYASDMTRCFFMPDHHKMLEIYEIVLKANQAAIDAVKPGIPLKDVDKAARDVISDWGWANQFVHRTGHGVGIEVHETLDVSQSSETIIKEGMCFSIEPGIYLGGIGGIRIEDLVLVGKNGAKILNSFPKDTKIVKL